MAWITKTTFCVLLTAALAGALTGCDQTEARPRGAWHREHSWTAERYFRDQPKVIELCYAIEARDPVEVDRLVAGGADVNARGLSGMTPLLWAYPDKNFDCFLRLLEHGADPNVYFESSFNTRGKLKKGNSVTHLAVLHEDRRYFDAVFYHKGDPDLLQKLIRFSDTPIFQLIKWGGKDRKERIKTLIKNGANLDVRNSIGATVPMQAISWGGQYDIALTLLKAGARIDARGHDGLMQITHSVLGERRRNRPMTAKMRQDYSALNRWLINNGADFSNAQADLDRWASDLHFNAQKERERPHKQKSEAE